jgi:hypothetical protein
LGGNPEFFHKELDTGLRIAGMTHKRAYELA